MIRLLYRAGVDLRSPLRWLLSPDPEFVARIEEAFDRDGADRASLTLAFARVVSSIRVGHIDKLTWPERLSEANHSLTRFLASRSDDGVCFLDIGGSDGATTLSTVRHLESTLGVTVHATIMDRYTHLERRGAGWIREYRTSDGSPVLVRFGPVGLQLSSLDVTRDPLSRWLGRVWLSRQDRREAMPMTRTIPLVSPAARAAHIRVVEWNALQRNADLIGSFDVVRASNVLNESYFSREQIELMLGHLHAYLRKDGLLVVSRTDLDTEDRAEQGSVWRRSGEGFERLHDYGGGSYIAAVVDHLCIGRHESPA